VRFISVAINSLRSQTFQNRKKLLISDNCSSDNTSDICQKHTKSDSRIFYYRQSHNIGIVNNFKFLLDQADSEYFMQVVAGDEWKINFLEMTFIMDKYCTSGLERIFI